MPPQKSTPKRGNTPNAWNLCENCSASLSTKDFDCHMEDCPPDIKEPTHSFVLDEILYGKADVKVNEEIKGVTPHDKDNMVFLSQSAIQLCNLSIGDYAIISDTTGELPKYGRVVWPTTEKALTSILFTKNCMEFTNVKPNLSLSVGKPIGAILQASKVSLTVLNAPHSMDLSPELQNRLQKSHLERLVTVGNILSIFFYGIMLKFEIKRLAGVDTLEQEFARMDITQEVQFYKVTEKTVFVLFESETEYKKQESIVNPFIQIGGLLEEITELRDLIDCVLGKRAAIPGFKLTRGVLLYGNSGTGKTLLANAFALSPDINTIRINMPDLYSKFSGNPEESVKRLFKEAREQTPSMILLDEVDILCPSRSSRMTDTEKRIVSSILTELDEINEEEDAKIFVLATSNKPEGIDAALRRCGRLEREIEIPVPNPKARFDILNKILNNCDKISEDLVQEAANDTHGFVGADLVALCSRAALHASQNNRQTLNRDDFKFALTRVRPSAMREVQIEVPNVNWSDIGGQTKLKLILKQCVEWPLKHADSFIRMGITPPRGVLMYGPPGCSKTMIAKALATESGLNFLSIKGPELFSKWVGESERAVREVFRKARQVAPSIVFFDEIDALGGERSSGAGGNNSVQERVLAQLLTELDGVTPLGDVTILAATNRPDRIDKALLRPGRLDRIVYVPLPDADTRRDIFRIKLQKMPVLDVDIDDLVKSTERYSGAEVNAVCHEAAMMALEEDLNATAVEIRHFKKAVELITPRTPDSLLKVYEEYNSK